ncbi:MAG: type III pantothenate kinase [Bacteroidales bacterium]|nr:type III pantothenate kinase [Bacteroidales bacterium]
MPHLILDIGNSRAKAAIMDNGKVKCLHAAESPEKLPINAMCKDFAVDAAIASVVGVQPDFDNILPTALLSRFHQLTYRSHLPIILDYETPQTLGMDRVAAACGARVLAPDGPLIIVDAGSCITIDFLNSDNHFKGGAILPGLNMRFRSLHDYTAALPLVSLDDNERIGDISFPLAGQSTRKSILAGVCKAAILELQGFAEEYQRLYPDVKLFLTGGDAYFFAKQLFFPNFATLDVIYIGLDKILEMNL